MHKQCVPGLRGRPGNEASTYVYSPSFRMESLNGTSHFVLHGEVVLSLEVKVRMFGT